MSTETENPVGQLDDELEVVADDDLEVVVDESDEGDTDEAASEDNQEGTDEPEASAEEDPAEESAPEATETEEDEELASMPAKFKKRLTREIRLREQIIAEREQIKTAAIQVAQLAKQREDEVVTLKKQNVALQRQFAETLDYAYERDISMKAQELRRAREDGDYDAEIKIQSELDTLRFQHNQVRQAKTTLPDPEAVVAPAPQVAAPQQQAPQQPQPQRQPPAPLAVKWIDNNKSWFRNPKFEEHQAAVLRIDAKLKAEGYDPNSKDYYEELDTRVDALFPGLRKKVKPKGSPVAPAGNAPASNTSKKTITITKADLNNMRAFGLDPTNKEHLREYARNKRAA